MFGVQHKKHKRSKFFSYRIKASKSLFFEETINSRQRWFKKIGNFRGGARIVQRRSLTTMYPVILRYLFRAIFKVRIFFIDTFIGKIFVLAAKRHDFAVNIYIILWYTWFSYVLTSQLINWSAVREIIPIYGIIADYLALWIGK